MSLRQATQQGILTGRDAPPRVPTEVQVPVKPASMSTSFTESFKEGWRFTLLQSSIDTVNYNSLGKSGNPITEEEWKAIMGPYAVDLEYEPGVTKEQADFLKADRFTSLRRNERINAADSPGSAFAGMMVGVIVDPVDMFIVGGVVTKAARTARTTRGYMKTLNNSRAQNAIAAGGFGAKTSSIQTIITEPFIHQSQVGLQRDYTVANSLATIAVSPFFGAGLGATIGAATHKSTQRAAMSHIMDGYAKGRLSTETRDIVKEIIRNDPKAYAERQQMQKASNDVDSIHRRASSREVGEQLNTQDLASNIFSVSKKRQGKPLLTRLEELDDMLNKTVHDADLLPSEVGIKNLMQDAFGTKVIFHNSDLADGRVYAARPDTVFIRKGAANPEEMPFLVGHEFGHVIKFTDPHMWGQLADFVSVADFQVSIRDRNTGKVLKGTLMDHARRKTAEHYDGQIDRLSDLDILDENMANIMGDAFQSVDFWRQLARHDKGAFEKATGYLRNLFVKIGKMISGKRNPPRELVDFHRTLADIVSKYDGTTERAVGFWKQIRVRAKLSGRKVDQQALNTLFARLATSRELFQARALRQKAPRDAVEARRGAERGADDVIGPSGDVAIDVRARQTLEDQAGSIDIERQNRIEAAQNARSFIKAVRDKGLDVLDSRIPIEKRIKLLKQIQKELPEAQRSIEFEEEELFTSFEKGIFKSFVKPGGLTKTKPRAEAIAEAKAWRQLIKDVFPPKLQEFFNSKAGFDYIRFAPFDFSPERIDLLGDVADTVTFAEFRKFLDDMHQGTVARETTGELDAAGNLQNELQSLTGHDLMNSFNDIPFLNKNFAQSGRDRLRSLKETRDKNMQATGRAASAKQAETIKKELSQEQAQHSPETAVKNSFSESILSEHIDRFEDLDSIFVARQEGEEFDLKQLTIEDLKIIDPQAAELAIILKGNKNVILAHKDLANLINKNRAKDSSPEELISQLPERSQRYLSEQDALQVLRRSKSLTPDEMTRELDQLLSQKNQATLAQHNAQNRMIDKQVNFKSALTFLDGIRRKGVKNIRSVASDINNAIADDLVPFMNMLESTGLARSFREGDADVLDDFFRFLEGGVPLKGEKFADEIVQLGELYRSINDRTVLRFQKAGSSIQRLENFSISQRYDMARVKNNKQQFIDDLLNEDNVDWRATEKNLGGILLADKGGLMPFDRRKYVQQVAEDIETGRVRDIEDVNEAPGNLGERIAQHRNIVYKPGKYSNIHRKYSPNSHMGTEVINQMITRARQEVIMRHFGPDYKSTLDVGLQAIKDPKQKAFYGWVFNQMAGDLDHPANAMGAQTLSSVGNKVRQLADVAFLGKAGISSIMDVSTMAATFRHQGVKMKDLETNIFRELKKAFDRARKGDNTGVEALRAHAAGLDAFLGASSRRFGGETVSRGSQDIISKMHNTMFNINGMNLWNRVAQEATIDIMQRHFASMVRKSNKDFDNAASSFGITREDLDALKGLERKVEGLEGSRILPEDIKNLELKRKYNNYMDEAMNMSVLKPTVSDEALLKFGTRSGTFTGEAVRSLTKYMSFPMAMTRKVYSRFLYGYGDEGFTNWQAGGFNRSQLDAGVFAANSMMMGWLVLNIKEGLAGREPVSFLPTDQRDPDILSRNVGRVVDQSGVLGIVGNVMQFADEPTNSRNFGPIFGPAGKTLGDAMDHDRARVSRDIIHSMPFNTLPLVRETAKGILASGVSDWYTEIHQKEKSVKDFFFKNKFGQDPLL